MLLFSVSILGGTVLCFFHHMTSGKNHAENLDCFRDIEIYARLKMDEYSLNDWQFGWDHARRRLGVCRLQKKTITLSTHFVRANLEAPHEIRDTILHEIAHALAWTLHGDRSHGQQWKAICREIGAVPRAAARQEAIRVTAYKYALRLKTTGEIIAKYHRRPAFTKHIKRLALKNRPETLGQLELVPSENENRPPV